jgi:hypothetical protein
MILLACSAARQCAIYIDGVESNLMLAAGLMMNFPFCPANGVAVVFIVHSGKTSHFIAESMR